MRNLPPPIIHVLRPFELLFTERMWEWVKILLVGTILAPGKRTVTACLRTMGLSHERQFQTYHRVLNRASWSSRKVSQVLLRLLVQTFVPADTPIILGIDEHIERRRGRKIAAKGIYRDPVRSSESCFVKTSGPCMTQRPCVGQGNLVDRARKAHGKRHWQHGCVILPRIGQRPPLLGMDERVRPCDSQAARRSGITAVYRPSPSAGYW